MAVILKQLADMCSAPITKEVLKLGSVYIQSYTTLNPISMIGQEAGCCWGADTTDDKRNYTRGIDCLESEHGRTLEFPDVYMVLDGYSARVIREWYTHIGGAPTRLQASTRYINYQKGFDYVTPGSIAESPEANKVYQQIMADITSGLQKLEALGIPREDSAMGLPLGMGTKIVCKHNLRNLIDMSHQRKCSRAYHEYGDLFADVEVALMNYSDQWRYLVTHYFQAKCEYRGFCTEKKSCGLYPRRGDT